MTHPRPEPPSPEAHPKPGRDGATRGEKNCGPHRRGENGAAHCGGIAMSSGGSVSRWVSALKDGDAAAAQPLWERYHRQLVTLARRRLQSSRRSADEEDVVQSAFHSFFRGVARGRFPQLNDRDNLWRLLVVITARKALDQLAREHSKKRGGGTPGDDPRITSGDDAAVEQVIGDEPTPEFAAQVAEEYQRLLD